MNFAAGLDRPCPHCGTPMSATASGLCLCCAGERALATSSGTCGPGARPASDAQTTPRWLGAYEILEEIGRGGMGTVHLARHVEINRLVALKIVAGGALATAEAEARFIREAQTTARLDHPNIVGIHTAGRIDGVLCYAMDFIDGLDLGRACAIDPLEPREAATLMLAVARAIAHAHERGVVHRDLKPSNILLDASGAPRVADFGIAQWTFEPAGLTRTGQILGSPAFMAPEQAAGAWSPAVDIYALGAVFYFALTGKPPFDGATALEVLARLSRDAARPPSALQAAVPAALDAVCLRCLNKEPAGRYACAADIAAELERWLAGEEVQTPFGPPAEARRLVESARALVRRDGFNTTTFPTLTDELNRAAQLDPDLASVHAELARLHISMIILGQDGSPARRELARAALERAEALDGSAVSVRTTRALHMTALEGRGDEAWPILRGLAREQPGDIQVQSALSRAATLRGAWSEALAAQRRLVDLEPHNANPRSALAYIACHIRRYEDAVVWAEEATHIDSKPLYRRLVLAWYRWQAEPVASRALRDLRAFPEAERHDPTILWCEAQVLLSQRRFDEALAVYRSGLDDDDDGHSARIEKLAHRLRLERWANDPGAAETEAGLRTLLSPGMSRPAHTAQTALSSAYAHAVLGNRAEALALADMGANALSLTTNAIDAARFAGANEFYTVPGRLIILAILDERERFFTELERLINVPAAIDPRYLALDPTFGTLRSDPRFGRIMATLQIPIPIAEA